ncbi:MAG: quinone-dependent dihydroorotate dehydrogenase [Flavobacteriales bacterium]|nr:quinone-dependent dihydroorotate dehydrogenase [Flavobacteriales bacterium]
MYRSILKPLLFALSAEKAHHFVMRILKFSYKIPGVSSWIKKTYNVQDSSLERELWGLKFPNPVGLAAGFDKDASAFKELAGFGFGFIEIGTVTPVGQAGNPKPRLFRLPGDEALINRMGFNNEGAEAAAERLDIIPEGLIIGGNIGKNKLTPNDQATDDYVKCFNILYPKVDYFVVNVSSPNTPNLRELQDKEPLTKLLKTLMALNETKPATKPILLKVAPDLSNEQLDDIVEIVLESGIQGLIATNTTIDRSKLTSDKADVEAIGNGGLSGKPLTSRSTEVIRYIHERSNGKIPIIGVGGIHSAEEALAKIDAGAVLVQVYTGFIYEGPSLVKKINKALIARS